MVGDGKDEGGGYLCDWREALSDLGHWLPGLSKVDF